MLRLGSRTWLAIMLAGGLAACSSPEEVSDDLGQQTGASSGLEQLGETIAAQAEAVAFEDNAERDGATREFSYGWPRQVSAEPELAALLEQERDAALILQQSQWRDTLETLVDIDCGACRTMSSSLEWQVVANLDRFLSLSANQYEFTGGAHGNYWFGSLVWDREAKSALDPRELFAVDALADALREPYCAALRAEQEKRRGGADIGGYFEACPGLEDLTLLVGSSDGERFDRLGLLAAPYVAGPYAEGAYEVTLDVTEPVLSAVKPEYRTSFVAR